MKFQISRTLCTIPHLVHPLLLKSVFKWFASPRLWTLSFQEKSLFTCGHQCRAPADTCSRRLCLLNSGDMTGPGTKPRGSDCRAYIVFPIRTNNCSNSLAWDTTLSPCKVRKQPRNPLPLAQGVFPSDPSHHIFGCYSKPESPAVSFRD